MAKANNYCPSNEEDDKRCCITGTVAIVDTLDEVDQSVVVTVMMPAVYKCIG